MQFLSALLSIMLAMGASPALSADPSQLFSTILGEIGRQIEHETQRKQLKRLRPLWEACAAGDVAACDRAAGFPNLTNQARADIARMRHAAELRPAYERNFYACQKMDRAACRAALAYPYLSDPDRRNLQSWLRRADQDQEILAASRHSQRACYAGSISACDAAINERRLDETAISDLERHRDRLREEELERQSRERQRQEELAAFRRNQRSCHSGSIAACDAALNNRHLNESAIPDLEQRRSQLQLAERQRRAREEQRQAEIREYARLRKRCADGERKACKSAATHAQVRASDIAFFERRDRELAPMREQVANFFGSADAGSGGAMGLVVLGMITLCGVGAGTLYVMRHRTPFSLARPDPPVFEPDQSAPTADAGAVRTFALTGHMPTDVRRAILEASQ